MGCSAEAADVAENVWAAAPQGAVPQGPAPAARFTDAERADLKRASDYLNSLKSLQGRFLQIDGSGRSQQGNFYLRKPGRVRFEYQKPNPNLIIADGTTVAVENIDLNKRVYFMVAKDGSVETGETVNQARQRLGRITSSAVAITYHAHPESIITELGFISWPKGAEPVEVRIKSRGGIWIDAN